MARITDVVVAAKAKRHGARYPLYIVQEARRAGLNLPVAFALIEQESNFQHIFGHDPTIFAGAGKVTKKKYLAYKAQRGHTRMQGVGLAQLTWWEFQDKADKYGGCWRVRFNLRVAFEHLAALIKAHGLQKGVALYNGTGPNADNYARIFMLRRKKWWDQLGVSR